MFEPVPPPRYGGVERVVGILTDELVAQGHEVTLHASGDSDTKAELVAACPTSLRLAETGPFRDFTVAIYMKMMMDIVHRIDEYDVIHFHTGFFHLPTFHPHRHKSVTTVHMPMSLDPSVMPVMNAFREMPYIGISADQTSHAPLMNWRGVVHHGLPRTTYSEAAGGDYLLFVGRIAPSKRPDRAIEIARRSGLKLKIAAKVDAVFRDYFEETVEPHIDGTNVEFLGEVSDQDKQELYGGARTLLFPIDWNEPFGLVLIEAMACGTPVVAWNMGSVPEIIEDGVTGFTVDGIDRAVEAVQSTADLDRHRIREVFDRRFTAERMAAEYVRQYGELLAGEVGS
ncbi:glycosyltransferase family 4 protein [Micromonospora vulcania]|uniref:Glycosyltransferase family 4 protein n=1 Tax=Micromonospora vulcania TaxID=1441873 RepID=A0ABW1GZ82_9ACTN